VRFLRRVRAEGEDPGLRGDGAQDLIGAFWCELYDVIKLKLVAHRIVVALGCY